jgi:RNA polymerase sigma-70 factor, ECF subfamily
MDTESIYLEFDAKLRRFILGRVSDPGAAEDILQNVYLKIHAHIGELREGERIESWIYQITRNAIIDHYRRKRPQEELSEFIVSPRVEEPDAPLRTLPPRFVECWPAYLKNTARLWK